MFEDGCAQYCRLGGLLSKDASRSRSEQAAERFEQMETLLQANRMEFNDVLHICRDELLFEIEVEVIRTE